MPNAPKIIPISDLRQNASEEMGIIFGAFGIGCTSYCTNKCTSKKKVNAAT